jgi:(S)-3,5-dihydroxyphenylglycine transaminase
MSAEVPSAGTDLSSADLHAAITDPVLLSMNILNEVAGRFPNAVPFAAGRPFGSHYDIARLPDYLDRFCEYLSAERGLPGDAVTQTLFQYGRTKGIIHELIARHLALDESIHVDPESIVVTVGCQEALFLALRTLRRDRPDVLVSADPTYVGVLGAARLLDMPVHPISEGPDGIDLDDLTTQVHRLRGERLRPRACYLVPDFANPSGTSMPTPARRRLLEIAEAENLLVLEDNPYGLFSGGDRLPTLKSLDRGRRVVYLGSLAKSTFPGARIGYVVADQRVANHDGGITLLADELAKIKSMTTVNTSPIAQAMVAGRMLAYDCSLEAANAEETANYRRNLRLLLDGLERRFAQNKSMITWNTPVGGFFVVLTVPFAVTDELLEVSGRDYGVLWTPMHHFFAGGGGTNQLRLSCSHVTPEQIEIGLDRLTAFIRAQSHKAAG